MQTETPAHLICPVCGEIPLSETTLVHHTVCFGLKTPYDAVPDRIHVLKHKKCRRLLYLPGKP